jgi:hypothetical protein
MALLLNQKDAIHYLEAQNFTEPLFVFAILVVAGTRPVLWAVQAFVSRIARVAVKHPARFVFSVPVFGALAWFVYY